MITLGPHTAYPALKGLPPLVKEQRRLEALIAPVTPLLEVEKDVRKQIDALLIIAAIGNGETVTCLGYDITHTERKGTERLNQDALVATLVSAGVDRVLVTSAIATCLETGEPSAWATVKPSKGATVKAPAR